MKANIVDLSSYRQKTESREYLSSKSRKTDDHDSTTIICLQTIRVQRRLV